MRPLSLCRPSGTPRRNSRCCCAWRRRKSKLFRHSLAKFDISHLGTWSGCGLRRSATAPRDSSVAALKMVIARSIAPRARQASAAFCSDNTRDARGSLRPRWGRWLPSATSDHRGRGWTSLGPAAPAPLGRANGEEQEVLIPQHASCTPPALSLPLFSPHPVSLRPFSSF